MKKGFFVKLAAIVVGTVTVLGLAACGSSYDETEIGSETETVGETDAVCETETEGETGSINEPDAVNEPETVRSTTPVNRTEGIPGRNETQSYVVVRETAATGHRGETAAAGSNDVHNGASGNGSSGNGSGGSSAGETHTHTWEEQTAVIWHDEVGHEEMQQVANMGSVTVCNACGQQLAMSFSEHRGLCPNGASSGYHSETIQDGGRFGWSEQSVYVMDRAGYEETVVTGYLCSTCGAVR